jgi:hypothetical protein
MGMDAPGGDAIQPERLPLAVLSPSANVPPRLPSSGRKRAAPAAALGGDLAVAEPKRQAAASGRAVAFPWASVCAAAKPPPSWELVAYALLIMQHGGLADRLKQQAAAASKSRRRLSGGSEDGDTSPIALALAAAPFPEAALGLGAAKATSCRGIAVGPLSRVSSLRLSLQSESL